MTRKVTVLLVTLTMVTVVAPWLAPYDPAEHHSDFLYAPPMPPHVWDERGLRAPFVSAIRLVDRIGQRYTEDRQHTRSLPWFDANTDAPVYLLGADSYGRDLLSRLLHGTRTTIGLGLVSALGALLLGALAGGLAGYRPGWIDEAVMRSADFILVLPVIYVVLVLRAVLPLALPPSTIFVSMAGIFVLVGWPFVARGVRGIVATEKQREYVIAGRSLGASDGRILIKHLLPACTDYLLVQATVLLPAFILAEATLSYAGLGFPDDVATWGTMLHEAATVTTMTRFPWTLAPALAIFLVVLSTNAILQSDKISRRPI